MQVLSQFFFTPRHDHLITTHKTIHYIKNAHGQGIPMSATSPFTLTVFCDSEWDGCKDSRQSLTDYCVQFGSSMIFLKCKSSQ